MTDRWIRCVKCNQVIHNTDYDCFPQYQTDPSLDEITEKPMDDMKKFMDQHKHHKIEDLTIVKDSFISEGRYGDPMKVRYFEATNGNERFIIKQWRDDINSSLKYELIPGYIKTNFKLEAQYNEIRKQISEEIRNPPLTENKIEQFIQIIEKVVSQLPNRDKIEISAETDTPLISYCKMDINSIRKILVLSKKIFNAEELKKIEQFIHWNNRYNEPMTLLLKKTFIIKREHPVPPKSEEPSLLEGIVAKRSKL